MSNITKGILAVIVIAVLIAAGVYISKRQPKEGDQNKGPVSTQVQSPEPGQNKVTAQTGKLVTGFPAELILESGVKFTESFKEDYGTNTHQYTATYSSSKSPQDLYKLYDSYLIKNSYRITNRTQTDKIQALYAEKDTATVNFNASKVDPNKPTQVVITYLVAADKK